LSVLALMPKAGGEVFASFHQRIADGQRRRLVAVGDQAGDQAMGHVAAADEGDARSSH
jgi:hypothetical protein